MGERKNFIFMSLIFTILTLIVLSNIARNESDFFLVRESTIAWGVNELNDSWHREGFQIFANKKVDRNQTYLQISQSLFFKNASSILLNLEKGKTYLVEADILNEDSDFTFGIWVIQDGKKIGYNYASKGSKSVGTKFKVESGSVEIKLGFEKRGLANVLVQNVSLKITNLTTKNFRNSQANTLYKELNLEPFDSLHYHTNVLSIVSYVNSFLISPLTKIL